MTMGQEPPLHTACCYFTRVINEVSIANICLFIAHLSSTTNVHTGITEVGKQLFSCRTWLL